MSSPRSAGATGLALGLCLGAVAITNWRQITKKSVILALRGGTKVREIGARTVEEFSDVAQEARWEFESGRSEEVREPEARLAGRRTA